MSCSFVQSKSAHSASGASVSATFVSNIAAGNGLLAAVTWIDPNENGAAYPTITVADTSHGAWVPKTSNGVTLGGDIFTQVFFIPYSKVGPNGAVVAEATAPGLMFISIHEVAPDAGEIFQFDASGINAGIGWASQFSFPLGTLVETIPNPAFNDDGYSLLVFSTRSGNINPTVAGMTAREYEANTTPVGSIGVLGSQATFDEVANFFGGPIEANPVWSYPSSIVNAVLINIASTPAVASPPTSDHATGEFSSHQTVTLLQAQGLEIHYTLDGTTPTGSSTLYSGPVSIATPTTIKAIAVQGSTAGWPGGFWADSTVASWTLDIFTGVCLNPMNIIDGNDTTFATLTSSGAAGDIVAAKANMMNGTTGGTGHLYVNFEVTQNDLVAPSQTLPAWKVSAFIGGMETVLASAAPGAGTVARNTVSQAVSAGVSAPTLAAKISAICQIAGSTGGVALKVYAAYFAEP